MRGKGWRAGRGGVGAVKRGAVDVQVKRKRTKSSGNDWDGCAGGPTMPKKGVLRTGGGYHASVVGSARLEDRPRCYNLRVRESDVVGPPSQKS